MGKACFEHDMAYGDFKNLTKRIVPGKVLRDEAFNNVKKQNMMVIKEVLLQRFTRFLKKRLQVVVLKV